MNQPRQLFTPLRVDSVGGERFRVVDGFVRGRNYQLLVDSRNRVCFKRFSYNWGDEIIAHYEEIQ